MKDRKQAPQNVQTAIAWYQPEEWPRLLEVAADRETLEDTYAQWLESAKRFLLDMFAQGIAVEKVDLRVDEWVAWCRKHRRSLDAKSRAGYASFKLQSKYEGKKG